MILENVKVVNHNETINNANIEIENGIIKSITKIKGEGNRTIIPGFIEPHLHGFGNQDCMFGKSAIEEISLKLRDSGVTSFFPTLMTASWKDIIKAMQDASDAEDTGAKIAGIHLEGPFISIEKKGAHDPKYLIKATKEKIDELLIASKMKLRRLTWAPEVNDMKLIPYLTKNNVVVNIGHTNATAKQTREAIKLGATSGNHLWNAMSGVVNREQGAVEALLMDDNVYTELISDLVHVDVDTIKFTLKNKTANKIIIVSDSIAPAGMPDGEYISGGLPVVKKGTTIRVIENQVIAGGAGSIDVGFNTYKKLDLPMEDIVKMTSYNVSINQKLEKVGVIKEGYYADIIVLDKKLNIDKVLVNGK